MIALQLLNLNMSVEYIKTQQRKLKQQFYLSSRITLIHKYLFGSLILLALAGSVGITLLIVACALPMFK